jgi:hypothetical protein
VVVAAGLIRDFTQRASDVSQDMLRRIRRLLAANGGTVCGACELQIDEGSTREL